MILKNSHGQQIFLCESTVKLQMLRIGLIVGIWPFALPIFCSRYRFDYSDYSTKLKAFGVIKIMPNCKNFDFKNKSIHPIWKGIPWKDIGINIEEWWFRVLASTLLKNVWVVKISKIVNKCHKVLLWQFQTSYGNIFLSVINKK